MTQTLKKVDHTALKVNQIIIIALNLVAFVINLPWLVAIVALVMLTGTIIGKPGFVLVYSRILKPLGWTKPRVIPDNPEPHRFAQGFGGAVMLAAASALYAGVPILGWSLVWLVAGLAALNAFAGFCVGCFIYYWLARLKVPSFDKRPPEGTFPGMRPELRKLEKPVNES
jgi:Domain of unknown function (DUF4395)